MGKETLTNIAHEIWATAQLLPEEGIEDGVCRIEKILSENFTLLPNQENSTEVCGACHGSGYLEAPDGLVDRCTYCNKH